MGRIKKAGFKFSDDVMFQQVMKNPEICRKVLCTLLRKNISEIRYHSVQNDITPAVDSRGIRVDAYVEDEEGKVYDIEMQSTKRKDLDLRMRYYQSAIDVDTLAKGSDFEQLRESYIIFICLDDPYGLGVPSYLFEPRCINHENVVLSSRQHWLVFNASAWQAEGDASTRSLLQYVSTGESGHDALTEEIKSLVSSENRKERLAMLFDAWEKMAMDHRVEKRAAVKEATQNVLAAVGYLQEKGRADEIPKLTDEAFLEEVCKEAGIAVASE